MNVPISIVIEFAVLIVCVGSAVIPLWVSSRNRFTAQEIKINILETELKHHKEEDEKDNKRWEEIFRRLGVIDQHIAKLETKVGAIMGVDKE